MAASKVAAKRNQSGRQRKEMIREKIIGEKTNGVGTETTHTKFDEQIAAATAWFANPRFDGIIRLYSPRQVAEQQGSLAGDYTVARDAAKAFYIRLRELFKQNKQIATFGPYSPGQAVMMKRIGLEGIYLGGWATSARGSLAEDPGPDLASYPLSQVPDEAASLVRALLTADLPGRAPVVAIVQVSPPSAER